MKEKINILFTIPNFKTAGSQYVLLALYQHIDRKIYKPFVLVERFPKMFPEIVKEDEQLHIPAQVGKPAYIKKLSRLLREKEIAVVHSWDYKSNSIEALACKLAGVAYVYTKKNNAWSKRWYIKSILSSHIAYDNPDMKNRFFSGMAFKNKITFVPHGIDISIFKPQRIRQSNEIFTIGCIGVLNSNKNQLLVLKALSRLPKTVQVVFYGKEQPAYKKELIAYIKTHNLQDRVHFKGFINNQDIPNAMATFNCTVLASHSEGLPVSILESMACGVPVLSSNSGGGARYLLENEQGGFIFEKDNVEQLITQLQKLIASPEKAVQIGNKGLQRVQKHFTIAQEALAYQQLYYQLLKIN